jgi:hypothetical protein
MARRSTLRASDQDREHVAERLRQAAAEGRLLAEELEHRLARALRARTYGELDPLVADLPAVRTGRLQRRGRVSPVLVAVGGLAIAIAVLAVAAIAIMLVTGLFVVWGFWVLLAWWFFGRGRHAGRHYGRRIGYPPHYRTRAQMRYGPRGHVRVVHRRSLL